ncbi:hypothetical protein [Nocardia sp. XZ_19_385]|uniref:hypothetical protein n=1 Tax=Nocardia sp. XZ_19_385 TaxID=2769488 RepID=UPI00188E23D4|nr:hypothetical protein [Nocardia sp. XZ_19_385]
MRDGAVSGNSWELSDRDGGYLAARWWQWALSAPADRSPVADETGEHAAWKQPAEVWFLAGTYGGRVVRRCAVPSGRPLFFPVINTVHPMRVSKEPMTMEVVSAKAYLNGVPLELREFVSPPFWAKVQPLWASLLRRRAWGLWAGLAPLAPGQYVLEIKASTEGGFWVDTTYHLTVD